MILASESPIAAPVPETSVFSLLQRVVVGPLLVPDRFAAAVNSCQYISIVEIDNDLTIAKNLETVRYIGLVQRTV